MHPRRGNPTAAKAHQDAQRTLRTCAALSIKEATETLTRPHGQHADAAPAPELPSVRDLTSRLLAKVDEAKRTRIDTVMRRQASAPGKKAVPHKVPVGPIHVDIRVAADEVELDDAEEEELCVVTDTRHAGRSPDSTTSFGVPPAHAEHSQASSFGDPRPISQGAEDDDDDADVAAELAKDKAMVDTIRRRHEIRRMNLQRDASRSVSPTDLGRSFPPPPLDAPLLTTLSSTPLALPPAAGGPPRSSLVSALPMSLVSPTVSLTLQRQRTASFTERISSACKEGDAAKIARLNSYDVATTKTTVTFTSSR